MWRRYNSIDVTSLSAAAAKVNTLTTLSAQAAGPKWLTPQHHTACRSGGMADARDLKSLAPKGASRFESGLRHHP
jgi:hypothetical protein